MSNTNFNLRENQHFRTSKERGEKWAYSLFCQGRYCWLVQPRVFVFIDLSSTSCLFGLESVNGHVEYVFQTLFCINMQSWELRVFFLHFKSIYFIFVDHFYVNCIFQILFPESESDGKFIWVTITRVKCVQPSSHQRILLY